MGVNCMYVIRYSRNSLVVKLPELMEIILAKQNRTKTDIMTMLYAEMALNFQTAR